MSKKKYRPKLNQKDKPLDGAHNKPADDRPFDGAQDRPAENSRKVDEVRRPVKDNWTDIDGLLKRIKAKAAAEKASGATTGDPSAIGADAVHRQADVAQQPSAKAEGARATPADPRIKQGEAAHAKAAAAAKIFADEGKAEEARRAESASGNGNGNGDGLDDWMSGLSDEEVKRWREYGETMLERLDYHVHGVSSGEGALSDDEVRSYLGNGVRFLNQTVTMTSYVLDTVDVKTLRRIVASDTDSTSMRKALKVLGRDADEVLGPEQGTGARSASDGCSSNDRRPSSASARQDWRKRPRGRRHPLLQLVTLACSAVRLMNQITRETNPHAHNRPTLEERQDAQFERVLGGISTNVERIAKR